MTVASSYLDFSLVTWLSFIVISIAAARIGPYFPRIGLPLITGYLFVGAFCGPYVLNLATKRDVARLSPITQFALAFIAFSAGAELYLPELRSLFRRILAMTTLIAVFTFTLVTLVVHQFSTTPLLPFLNALDADCRLSVATIVAAIMVARSPASAIAVIKEMRAKGPFTSTALGVTVLCDVYVLLAFTLTTSVAESSCREEHEEGFNGMALLILIATITASIVIGWGVGKLLLLLMSFKRIPAKYLILPLGLLIFVACQAVVDYTHENSLYVVNLEPLLICITGGFVCTNQSSHRLRFIKVLQLCGPYVFLPFFVLTGASLDLSVLLGSLGFALIVVGLRALCIFLGSGAGGVLTAAPALQSLYIWCTLLTQAGVSLGLASEVGMSFPGWGRAIQTSIIACVLINQLVGPVLFKYALKKVGEAGKDKGGENEFDEDAEIPDAIFVGPPGLPTMTAAARLMQGGWKVTFAVDSAGEAAEARELLVAWGVAQRDSSASAGSSAGGGAAGGAGGAGAEGVTVSLAAPAPAPTAQHGAEEEHHGILRKLEDYVSVVVIGGAGEGGSSGSLWEGMTLPSALAALSGADLDGDSPSAAAAAAAAPPSALSTRWAKLTALVKATPNLASILLALPQEVPLCNVTTVVVAARLTAQLRSPTLSPRQRRARVLATTTLPAFSHLLAESLGCTPLQDAPLAAVVMARMVAAPPAAPLALFPLGAAPKDMAAAVHKEAGGAPSYAWLWQRVGASRAAAAAAASDFPQQAMQELARVLAERLASQATQAAAALAAAPPADAVSSEAYMSAISSGLKEDVTMEAKGKVERSDKVEMYGSIALEVGGVEKEGEAKA